MIRSLSYLPGKIERIEVKRDPLEAREVKDMLVSFGFDVRTEVHCGFVLIHWSFPKPKLVLVK